MVVFQRDGYRIVLDPETITGFSISSDIRELEPEPGDRFVRRELVGTGTLTLQLSRTDGVRIELVEEEEVGDRG